MVSETVNADGSKPDDFIERIIQFPNGDRYERIEALTDLRKDPGEARIIYTCRRVLERSKEGSESDEGGGQDDEFVMKVKVQWPGPQQIVHEGPSPSTTAELQALTKFSRAKLAHVPHLVDWKRGVQGPDGLCPGGYIVYLVVTKMPGLNLFDLGYWSLPKQKRAEIQTAFIARLADIAALGIAPYDCALRNVLWHDRSAVLSIVDFEHYTLVDEGTAIADELRELQRWGLAQRPPPTTWHAEWARGH